ncbi:gamma-glutamyl-gamma-aminobutyrate hydrolase family protein [Bacillaceae bacterium IKA-2]|jgi:gamma-glutamyl-gamma-aminobutyrate hydrolase PuuD|nr:gamma-glutamyl-gamma-aminobutyrate hydrolase family protein [Bacillaceae bacterium IKA-2]
MDDQKPIIGISLAYYGVESLFERKYHVNDAYIEAIKKSGGIPLLIPIMEKEDLLQVFNQISGLLLTGGGGLLPHIKKRSRLPSLYEQNPIRHQFDKLLANLALDKNLPVMGVCRGLQVINECLGGTLHENLNEVTNEDHRQETLGDVPSHTVTLEENSIMFSCFNKSKIKVNSFHNQAVKEAGHRLKVTAKSKDGIIEAVEGIENSFILGLQFHPEEQMIDDPSFAKLYQKFIQAAKTTNV